MSLLLTISTILCVFGISIGQMLFKKAATALPPEAVWQDWLFNGWLLSAFALYGLTTIAWVWILKHAPLHIAYPFMGLAFLIVPLLGWLFLQEPVHPRTFIGGALILAGIIVTGRT
ncbi:MULTISPECIES: EamA family transporter [unclassified Acidovorax]|uniref:EamA family transporter n=1 Tax=unclassified Acidovorax TaxID=2684926 RepID=UPI002882EF81|nr:MULTISPECIES: EamA family transporter [unclassified Acidovorax]